MILFALIAAVVALGLAIWAHYRIDMLRVECQSRLDDIEYRERWAAAKKKTKKVKQ